MKGQYGKIRYSSWNFIQDITFFVINYFFSFPENVKKDLRNILYLRKDPRPAFDFFRLKIVNTKYLHAFDLDQDPSFESYDDRLQIDEPKRHVLNFESFLDLFEVDEEDVSIRIFSLSLQGRVKSWFKTLPDVSISYFQQFVKVFLDMWVVRYNPFVDFRRV